MGRPLKQGVKRGAIAQAVIAVRQAHGLTQRDLAECCKVQRDAINRVERGMECPTMLLLRIGQYATDEAKQVIIEALRERLSGANEFLREVVAGV